MPITAQFLAIGFYVAFVFCSAFSLATNASAADISVGIRKDAKPFAMLDKKNFPQDLRSYSGFVAGICREVIQSVALKRGHRVSVKPVSVTERFSNLTGEARTIDLACGPISITVGRLDKYVFSFPVFLSGISYAIGSTNFGNLKRDQKVGVLWNTTVLSELGVDELSGHLGIIAADTLSDLEMLSALSGPDDPATPETLQALKHVVPVGSYNEGFKKLCDIDIDYFFGDVDILATFSDDWKKSGCQSTVSRVTLTREMYGVVFSPEFITAPHGEGLQFYMDFQQSLFSLLQSERLSTLFRDTFGNKRMSDELAGFFRAYQRVYQ